MGLQGNKIYRGLSNLPTHKDLGVDKTWLKTSFVIKKT